MVGIKFFGRGGQGVETSAELTALAAVVQGKYAEAFPNFGLERLGAPVTTYVRISDNPIHTHGEAISPDVVVVLDPSLLSLIDVTADLKPEGLIIVNTKKSSREIRRETGIETRLATVDASETSLEITHLSLNDSTSLGTLIIASQVLPQGELSLVADDPRTPVAHEMPVGHDLSLDNHFPVDEILAEEMSFVSWKELEPGAAILYA